MERLWDPSLAPKWICKHFRLPSDRPPAPSSFAFASITLRSITYLQLHFRFQPFFPSPSRNSTLQVCCVPVSTAPQVVAVHRPLQNRWSKNSVLFPLLLSPSHSENCLTSATTSWVAVHIRYISISFRLRNVSTRPATLRGKHQSAITLT